jgi:hypothetical protein
MVLHTQPPHCSTLLLLAGIRVDGSASCQVSASAICKNKAGGAYTEGALTLHSCEIFKNKLSGLRAFEPSSQLTAHRCQIHTNGKFGVESSGGAQVDIALSSRVHSNESGDISGTCERSKDPTEPTASRLTAASLVDPSRQAAASRLTAASLVDPSRQAAASRLTAASLVDPAREAAAQQRHHGAAKATARSSAQVAPAASRGAAAEAPQAARRPVRRAVKPLSAQVGTGLL